MQRAGPADRPSGDCRAGFPFRSYKRPSRCLAEPPASRGLLWIRLDQQRTRTTMDKHLLGLVWGLPASFALPSVAACRRALAHIRPRLTRAAERPTPPVASRALDACSPSSSVPSSAAGACRRRRARLRGSRRCRRSSRSGRRRRAGRGSWMRRIASLVTHSVIGACDAIVSASSRTRASMRVGRHDLVDEAGGERLVGGEQPRREDQLLQARRPEQVQVARVGLHRQAVAERARDRRAEARVRRRDAQVGAGGDAEAAADREALDLRDDRLPDAGRSGLSAGRRRARSAGRPRRSRTS